MSSSKLLVRSEIGFLKPEFRSCQSTLHDCECMLMRVGLDLPLWILFESAKHIGVVFFMYLDLFETWNMFIYFYFLIDTLLLLILGE